VNCHNCQATTTNGLALCDLCRRWATSALDFLPVYFRNLARWRRPARPNGSLGARGQWLLKRGVTEGSRIDRALDECGNALNTWAKALHEDRPGFVIPAQGDDEAQTVNGLCFQLGLHLTTIATLEWCGEFLREIDHHERTLRGLTETCVPGWYAGECRRESGGSRCGHPTHVVPGLTWVTCGACGSTTYARDHLDVVLEEARGWVAPPKRLAEAIVALVDSEPSVPALHDRIRQWSARGRIEALRKVDEDGDEVGPKRYRLGDVMDLLGSETRGSQSGGVA
jgi:hypothetical protein